MSQLNPSLSACPDVASMVSFFCWNDSFLYFLPHWFQFGKVCTVQYLHDDFKKVGEYRGSSASGTFLEIGS